MVNKKGKIKILTFSEYYLPGYKGGGPLRTISNMVKSLSDAFEFWIITSDRDLGDTKRYPSIEINTWQNLYGSNVYYTPKKDMTPQKISNIISSTDHDIIYINSFFSLRYSIIPLIGAKLYKPTRKPILVAPRGEFSPGALQFKKTKKAIYITTSKITGLYRNVFFQASSEHEAHDIRKALSIPPEKVKVAKNIPDISLPECAQKPFTEKTLRVVFLSRITPKKNLAFAINILSHVKSKIIFDIYGPKEDIEYWEKCQKLISQLPENIKAEYKGSIHPNLVKSTFSKYDLFLFPTHGENYGHVIAESLICGTPVLISDQTPWKNLGEKNLGWELPLTEKLVFSEKIEQLSALNQKARSEQRKKVQQSAIAIISDPEIIQDNICLFNSILK